MARLDWLNALSEDEAREALHRCCGSIAWAREMAQARPFPTVEALHDRAEKAWRALDRKGKLEAFSHHPRIGDVDALRAKLAGWASQEQGGVRGASEEVLHALARGNDEYEKKFGFVFLICATGKSADEMLAALTARLGNDAATELENAAGEQAKITRLRLEKLLA